jgi:hypothetical protein
VSLRKHKNRSTWQQLQPILILCTSGWFFNVSIVYILVRYAGWYDYSNEGVSGEWRMEKRMSKF